MQQSTVFKSHVIPRLMYVGASSMWKDTLARHFGDRMLLVQTCPPPDRLPTEVLIVDIGTLVPRDIVRLEFISRLNRRPSLILLDDGHMTREALARIAADALLAISLPAAVVTEKIEAHRKCCFGRPHLH